MAESPGGLTLTVIMPAYNEAEIIARSVEDVRREVLDRLTDAELIVVDDGSRDATGAILDALARAEPRLRVIHQQNVGHGPALQAGLAAASGTWLFLVDSDGQIPLHAFATLWATRGRDGAFGVRVGRRDPPLRLVLTRVIRVALSLLFGVRLRDANAPFKLLRREVWLEAAPLIPLDTLAPSLFLAVFARYRRLDIAECEVPHRPRTTGVGSIRRWRLVSFCGRALRQLVAFRTRLTATDHGG